MEVKWQKLRYMNGIPLGEDGRRVTGCKEHIELSRKAAREGMVLLKNEHKVLPLKNGQKIAVFGKAQADYVKGGGGSGDVTVAYIRSIYQGLKIKESEGKVRLFDALSDFYVQNVKEQYAEGKNPGMTVEPELPQHLVDEARAFTDTALITICRFSGEGYDRTGEAFDGDYFLSREENAMVEKVLAAFSRVVVVLNTGGMMDTLWFKDNEKVASALLAWQAGMEGGLATADVLCGDECPSGRLTDTFAVNFAAYPSSETFNISEKYVEYQEDIYVGYRYFETIPGAAEKVCYPFGYGLSYTEFSVTDAEGHMDGDQICVTAKITNTGDVAGRQVLQVYCQAPQGLLGKPARVLTGFAKTKTLAPGESETLCVSFDPYRFASYDDSGKVRRYAYVLEKGSYAFYAGVNVRDTQKLAFTYEVEENRVLEQLASHCAPTQLKKRMLSDGSFETFECPEDQGMPPYNEDIVPYDGQFPDECRWLDPSVAFLDPDLPQFIEVYEGKVSLDDFMKNLTEEQMVFLLGGQPNRGVANTFGFGNLLMYGIPNAMTADGPAGLRIRPHCGVNTTAFPCATLLACTWDPEIVYKVGEAGAKEVHENGIGIWLTPAMNIHRTPLCGRNFEYYSEDPLVAGKMASAMVRGIQSQGVAASVKHFACNNKETNRRESDSRLSERALREIYIKGFEICVKEAQPWTLMSSYNIINGTRASENHGLLTDILRGEWGFDGIVTTDWYTHGEQYREIAAGNDIKMACGMVEHTLGKLHSGELSQEALVTSVKRLLNLMLKLA